MKKYFPVLLSKAGEMIALSNLRMPVKSETSPILQVLSENLFDDEGAYKTDLAEKIIASWAFADNQLLIDVSLIDDIDGSIASIQTFFETLLDNGVNVVPVVGFNSSNSYIQLVIALIAKYGCKVCIRENNESRGFLNYNTNMVAMVGRLGILNTRVILLIDLGFVDATNRNLLIAFATQLVNGLPTPAEWDDVIVSAGSFLTDLTLLPAPATYNSPAVVHRLPRFEWQIWLALLGANLIREIKYGDYGTKHPYYVPAAFEGSASIKYTLNNEFLIYRGRKASDHARGGNQYNDSAAALIITPDYSGQAFSWGDDTIFQIGNRPDRPGNAGTWVQISQNHHITLLHSLL